MANRLSATERAVLEEQLVPAFRSILGEAPIPTDPAELELLAATLLVPLELPEMPGAVTRAFFDELVATYRDLRLGAVDASIVAAAERLDISDVATVDRRHFGVFRPRHVTAFTLLP
jgi:hypothetical protein